MKIIKMYIRHYRDNDQRTFYVEWSNGSRTEGRVPAESKYMQALFFRGLDDDAPFSYETW
jgi:hypothetical protein